MNFAMLCLASDFIRPQIINVINGEKTSDHLISCVQQFEVKMRLAHRYRGEIPDSLYHPV